MSVDGSHAVIVLCWRDEVEVRKVLRYADARKTECHLGIHGDGRPPLAQTQLGYPVPRSGHWPQGAGFERLLPQGRFQAPVDHGNGANL